jgi:hypothetical protein
VRNFFNTRNLFKFILPQIFNNIENSLTILMGLHTLSTRKGKYLQHKQIRKTNPDLVSTEGLAHFCSQHWQLSRCFMAYEVCIRRKFQESPFSLPFVLPRFTEEFWSSELQTLSMPRNLRKYFSKHDRHLFLKDSKFPFDNFLPVFNRMWIVLHSPFFY